MRLMRVIGAWLTLLLATLVALPATAQNFPKFTGLVVDAANVLPQATRDDLTRKLQALQHDTNRQLVVATIPDLQGYPLDDYGYRLGRSWGVGLRDVNNGIILFVAPNEPKGQRGPRIEVGRGLEPVVTDALASVIINQQMLPKLKASNDVPAAMEAGADALIAQLRASPDEAQARTAAAVNTFNAAHRHAQGGGIPFGLIFWLIIFGVMALSWLRRAGGDSYHRGGNWPIVLWGLGNALGGSGGSSGWSNGGSDSGSSGGWGGSDFSGGGGGDFGGGGASGDW